MALVLELQFSSKLQRGMVFQFQLDMVSLQYMEQAFQQFVVLLYKQEFELVVVRLHVLDRVVEY